MNTSEILKQIEIMKDYENIESLRYIHEKALERIERTMSDLRTSRNPEIIKVASEIMEDLPGVNCIVLRASALDSGKKWVYDFTEIESSKLEDRYFDELSENLSSLNNWLTQHDTVDYPNGLEEKIERLVSLNLYPVPEEFDWSDIEDGNGVEVLLVRGGKTYWYRDDQI